MTFPGTIRKLRARRCTSGNTTGLTEKELRGDGRVHIFTDGSAHVGDRSGGWGVILLHGDNERRLCGGKPNTTIGEMELLAVVMGMRALKSPRDPVTVYSDSQYVVRALSLWHHGWARRGWVTSTGSPVKHVELIKEAVNLAVQYEVAFRWVRGHNGHWANEAADALAKQGRMEHGGGKCRSK